MQTTLWLSAMDCKTDLCRRSRSSVAKRHALLVFELVVGHTQMSDSKGIIFGLFFMVSEFLCHLILQHRSNSLVHHYLIIQLENWFSFSPLLLNFKELVGEYHKFFVIRSTVSNDNPVTVCNLCKIMKMSTCVQ